MCTLNIKTSKQNWIIAVWFALQTFSNSNPCIFEGTQYSEFVLYPPLVRLSSLQEDMVYSEIFGTVSSCSRKLFVTVGKTTMGEKST